MFALTVQASLGASVQRFEEVIVCVRSIRDAWKQVAAETSLHAPVAPAVIAKPRIVHLNPLPAETGEAASRWTA